ncbi:hypothetical protein ASE16_17915 [Leifsonia sp. Root227]|nr:hypothetical protein ASE16_17915 [Leifsonia sp. Root227]
MYSVDAVWDGSAFRGPATYEVDGDILREVRRDGDPRTSASAPAPIHLGGTLIPRLTDHHTHLGLTDQRALFTEGITDAVDLGWIPDVASTWLTDDLDRPAVAIAGALLTSPGGYPVNAGWGPPGSSAELTGPVDARNAVREQVMLGASRIKVALNTEAGGTVDDSTLAAIVEEAASSGVPVTVHAQGEGQVARAIAAGAAQLAHAPFTERIGDADLLRAVAAGMSWVSTLDIHGWGQPTAAFAVAQDNLRRFAAAGGSVLYGTDLGNGPLAVGVNRRELEAIAGCGLDGAALVASIASAPASTWVIGPRFALVPTAPPSDPADLPAWLATATGRTVATLPTSPAVSTSPAVPTSPTLPMSPTVPLSPEEHA